MARPQGMYAYTHRQDSDDMEVQRLHSLLSGTLKAMK